MSFGLAIYTKEGKISFSASGKSYRLLYEVRLPVQNYSWVNGYVTTIDVVIPGIDSVTNKFAVIANSRIFINSSGNLLVQNSRVGYSASQNSYEFIGSDTIRCYFAVVNSTTLGDKYVFIFSR